MLITLGGCCGGRCHSPCFFVRSCAALDWLVACARLRPCAAALANLMVKAGYQLTGHQWAISLPRRVTRLAPAAVLVVCVSYTLRAGLCSVWPAGSPGHHIPQQPESPAEDLMVSVGSQLTGQQRTHGC
jgi:hypothetical protein